MIALYILLLIVGFVALVKGADIFVSGSASVARRYHVSGLIIGLTIVALGTSAPELAVSVSAALRGSNEIAVSNVVGSNIFNLLVVLGTCAMVKPLTVDKNVLKRDFPIELIATVFVLFITFGLALIKGTHISSDMAVSIGKVTRLGGLSLLIFFALYMGLLIYNAKKHPEEDQPGEILPMGKCVLFIILGIALIVGGGQATVISAKEIARTLGMTETLIGLTVVAVGTSLPELVTSIVAARKGEVGLAIGNAVGSNIFNILLILGASALIHPVAVNMASIIDLFIVLGISLITYLFSFTGKKINRAEGGIMVLLYIAEVTFAILR